MAFQKGHTKVPGSGMRPGQKSEKVQAWEVLSEYITNELADEYLEWVKTLPLEDKAKQFQIMLEYFKPKLQRSNIDLTSNDKELSLPTFNFVDFNKDERD
jgi:hypothetical protein